MSFVIRANGSSRAIDRAEVRHALEVLIGPGEYHELRGLSASNGQTWAHSRLVHHGDWETAVDAAYELSQGIGVYYTLNPVSPDLGDRGASTKHIVARRWFLVDIDRRKLVEPDQSATQQEKDDAFSLLGLVCDWLIGEGWPSPVIVDSGNGGHLAWRIDLPADRLSHLLLKRALQALAARWTHPRAEIDTKVYDAPRIAKLPGTWARKGIDTEERPHRLARLLHVPDPIEIVTVEQLEALASCNELPPEKAYDPWRIKVPTFRADRAEAYVKSAVERELARVVLANPGNRNVQLNTAAFALGQLVGGRHLDRGDAEHQLAEVARRTGLGDAEIIRTIESGLDAGIAQPRELPVSIKATSKRTFTSGSRLIILASEIKPRKVEWLWPSRIPLGKLTTFAGWGGLGKSFVTMDMAARISRGDTIPGMDGLCFEQGNVLILNTEDDPEDTSVPRLIEAGADLKRIAFARSEILGQFTLADLDMLEVMFNQLGGARFLVIDPATSFLGDVNDHHNAELRSLLTPLALWVMAHKCGTSLVTHVTKPQTLKVEAMARVMGSVAWVNAVRAAIMFTKDPRDPCQRLFIPFKTNNAEEQKALSYRIQKTDDLARVEWIGEVETTADEALNNRSESTAGQDAADWFEEMFRYRREWDNESLKRMGLSAGHSFNALFKSKEVKALPIKKRPRSGPKGTDYWVWIAEPGWPSESSESPKVDP
jgi:hypothetical protein